jgi:hypothetical protein
VSTQNSERIGKLKEFDQQKIEFVANQDGAAEREFMSRLSDTVFPEFIAGIRAAYLIRVRYDKNSEQFVALCIVLGDGADRDAIRRRVQDEFAEMFSSDMSLDILFTSTKHENALKDFSPFYKCDNQIQPKPDFYLASTEGFGLNRPHACWLQGRVRHGYRDDIALVTVSPSVDVVARDGTITSLDYLALAGRHVGPSIFDDHEWPFYVHIARPLEDVSISTTSMAKAALENVAWGEIYRTTEEARKAVGGK